MKKTNLTACFAVAFVWFSSAFVGGWATGAMSYSWFVRHGWTAIWLPVIGMVIIAFISWLTVDYGREIEAREYRTFMDKLYGGKILPSFYELSTIIGALIAFGTSLSSAGNLAETYGINYWIGILLMCVICIVGCLFGASIVRRIGSYMGTVIVVCVMAIFFFCFKERASVVGMQISRRVVYTSIGQSWYGGFYFVAMSVGLMLSLLPITCVLKTRKETTLMIVIGATMQVVVYVAINFTLMSFMPELSSAAVPMLYIVTQLDRPALLAVYSVVLLFALITTVVTMLYSFAVRFKPLIKIKNEKFNYMVTILALLITGSCLSSFGLIPLVSKGYTIPSYIAIALVGIGIPVLVFVKRKQAKKTQNIQADNAPKSV